MIPTRRFWALPALALTLVLGACSTPDDLNAPVLEPQFGSADEDLGVDVAFVSTGRIYSLSEQSGDWYKDDGSGYSSVYGYYSKVLLTRRDANGNTAWTREIASEICDYDYERDGCSDVKARVLEADANGNTYALVSHSYDSENYAMYGYSYSVYKYNASSNQIASIYLGSNGSSYAVHDSRFVDTMNIAVDPSGNVYAASMQNDFDYDTETNTFKNVVAKYSTSGSLLWQRVSTVGVPYGITVSSTGSVYVVGDKGLARYSNSGNLNWTKTGNFEEVMISGSNLYTRYRTNIFKFDGNGKQLWKRTQSGLTSPSFADMKGDGNGNVYLAGKYNASSTNRNAFIRKLNSSGSVLWTKTYGTSAYDDALGIATINGSEIYTTGSTQGSLAHTNIGGSDAYLRKVNSSGTLVWTR